VGKLQRQYSRGGQRSAHLVSKAGPIIRANDKSMGSMIINDHDREDREDALRRDLEGLSPKNNYVKRANNNNK